MTPVSEALVLEALSQVQDPDLKRDIVRLGFVKNIQIQSGAVSFDVELTTPACPVKDILKAECEAVVRALPGVASVAVNMTARVIERKSQQDDLVPNVRQIIAVASGKGGVGKSTVSVNLAVALAKSGAKVGLLDADVYGPSIPMMLGCTRMNPAVKDGKILPIERFGVQMMSLGLLMEDDQVAMWRGPMVAGTVRQLLADVLWGELDYLLVDLPPGTGDAPMSLAQLVPLTGVVIVTTPHAVAANIAGKCAALFRRLNSPVLGVIENMASFACPNCHSVSQIFKGLQGEALAERLETAYLGSIPLDPEVSESSEMGEPSLIRHPQSLHSAAFSEVSRALAAQVSVQAMARKAEEAQGFTPVSEAGAR